MREQLTVPTSWIAASAGRWRTVSLPGTTARPAQPGTARTGNPLSASVGRRLALGFGAVAACVAVAGGLGTWALDQQGNTTDDLQRLDAVSRQVQ